MTGKFVLKLRKLEVTQMVRTTADVLEEFRLRGISVAEWARHNGFYPTLVYQVLRSRHVRYEDRATVLPLRRE